MSDDGTMMQLIKKTKFQNNEKISENKKKKQKNHIGMSLLKFV